MARPEKFRRICRPPGMTGFQPLGINRIPDEPVQLTFEEYESLRLVSYENLSQEDAAVRMEVSRPTLTRIYNRAIQKVAKTLVEGCRLEIGGGNYNFGSPWFRCRKCHRIFEGKENHRPCAHCCDYGEDELIDLSR